MRRSSRRQLCWRGFCVGRSSKPNSGRTPLPRECRYRWICLDWRMALSPWRKSVKPTGGDDWLLSSVGTSEFNVDLVNLNDLPKDKMINIEAVKQAMSIASTLVRCDVAGSPVGEHRPHPVKISLDDRLQLVDYTDKADSGLDQLADIIRRCGNKYFVAMIADSDNSSPAYKVKEAAVENILTQHGISLDRLLKVDYQAGMLVTQSSNPFIGDWSSRPIRH